MSHSKRNTSLAFFTAHERAEAATHWGSKSTRLTRDSFLPFGSCQLCLQQAREPVACTSHGHLFCRECAVSNLLAQNQELKRLRKEAERRKAEDAEERDLADKEASARAVEEFERTQAGLAASKGVKRKKVEEGEEEDEVLRLAREGMMGGKKGRVEAGDGGKSELPAFWVPSEIPEHKKGEVKAVRAQPVCPAAAADQSHEFTLKTLVTVHFAEDKPTAKDTPDSLVRSCPSCHKALSNSTKAILAKPCGHVLCKPCSDKFQRVPEKSAHEVEVDESVRCYVCQEDVTPGRRVKRSKKGGEDGGKEKEREREGKGTRGLVELSSDGTGFAGGGRNVVRKQGVAFQC